MFDASDGLFHFVFADRNDDYYTPDYLKLKFIPYLRDNIVKADYSHVFILGRRKNAGEKNCVLQIIGTDSRELLKPAKKSIFQINITSPRKPAFKKTYLSYDVEDMELTRQEMLQQYIYLLEQAKQGRDMAIVIPAEMFAEFSEDAQVKEALDGCRRKFRAGSNSNIIVLTFSLDPDDNDIYFRYPANEFADGSAAPRGMGAFCCGGLFPEVEKALCTVPASTSQLVFHYDALKRELGDRMMVWDNMSHGAISSAIHYFYLHSADFYEFSDADACANMIWAWYSSPAVREKYYYFDLPSIRTYSLSELMRHFSDPKIRAQIQKGAEEENASELSYMLEKYGGREACIVNRDKSSPFVNYMIKLRGLVRSHGDCLDREQKKALPDMIARFDRPSYVSAHSFKRLTLEGFAGERRNITEQLLNRLLDSKEWNAWDNAAARILFLVFDLCCREADIPCNIDSHHLLESVVSEKSFDAIAHCMEQSKNAPFAQEEACAFSAEAEKMLYISADSYLIPAERSAARERIKNWRV